MVFSILKLLVITCVHLFTCQIFFFFYQSAILELAYCNRWHRYRSRCQTFQARMLWHEVTRWRCQAKSANVCFFHLAISRTVNSHVFLHMSFPVLICTPFTEKRTFTLSTPLFLSLLYFSVKIHSLCLFALYALDKLGPEIEISISQGSLWSETRGGGGGVSRCETFLHTISQRSWNETD